MEYKKQRRINQKILTDFYANPRKITNELQLQFNFEQLPSILSIAMNFGHFPLKNSLHNLVQKLCSDSFSTYLAEVKFLPFSFDNSSP